MSIKEGMCVLGSIDGFRGCSFYFWEINVEQQNIMELCMHCCISLEHGSLLNNIRRVLVTPFPLYFYGELFANNLLVPDGV